MLARSHARLRVLISDPGRAVRDGNRFFMMARRLTSYIDLRNVAAEYRNNPCAFIIADDKTIAFRQQASKWEGIVEFDDTNIVKRYLALLRRSVGRQPDPAGTAGDGRRLLETATHARAAIMTDMVWKPDVTVAAVAERDGQFLLVEERASGRIVLNQPAGHLESGETFLDAVVRETLEETGWIFRPEAIVGVYVWQPEQLARTFLRVAFSGVLEIHDPDRPLDHGILRTRWCGRDQLVALQTQAAQPAGAAAASTTISRVFVTRSS